VKGGIAIPLFLALLVRSIWLAAIPAFEVNVRVNPPVDFRLVGLRATLDAGRPARVEAVECFPGHEAIGPLWLGIPTHAELRGVRVEVEDADGRTISLRSAHAEWHGSTLKLSGPVRVARPSGEEVVRAAEVSPAGIELSAR